MLRISSHRINAAREQKARRADHKKTAVRGKKGERQGVGQRTSVQDSESW